MASVPEPHKRAEELGRLWWLVDAPLFIDRDLVDRLHDAIVWPELAEQYSEEAKTKKVETALSGQAEAEGSGDLGLPNFAEWLLPKLAARAKIAGQANRKTLNEATSLVSGRRIENSERKLHDLAVEYLLEFPDRILFVDVPGAKYSSLAGEVSQDRVEHLLESPPRPLVFVDIKPKSPIFPTMIEMEMGGFRPVYERLEREFAKSAHYIPKYPGQEDDIENRVKYWEFLKEYFSSRIAMQAVEDACHDGRIGWIDFRILFDDSGLTLHLHAVPAGRFHTGIFGYNFIRRGYKYGCRVVGSLKKGNDVNVLAIYDR